MHEKENSKYLDPSFKIFKLWGKKVEEKAHPDQDNISNENIIELLKDLLCLPVLFYANKDKIQIPNMVLYTSNISPSC